MKSILITELAADFLVQGLGLHSNEHNSYVGKVGRHEVELISSSQPIDPLEGEVQVLYLSTAKGDPFRAGDVLMVGSDDLLDRAFQALDEMEQRGVVVGLSPVPGSGVSVTNEKLFYQAQEWKEKKIPFLCLFLVEPVDSEGQAKFVSLVRKVIS